MHTDHPQPRLVVVGAAGQVGRQVTALVPTARALTSADCNITDPASVARALDGLTEHDVIVNLAAYTAVDAAETDYAGAAAVNTGGPENLARQAARCGAAMIHVSTDYVFSGDATEPYRVDAPTDPQTVYGRTKLDGEVAARSAYPDVTIVRTAWVYTGAPGAADFVATMRRLESDRDSVSVVDDQRGSPTYAADLAAGLVELAYSLARGKVPGGHTFHVTNAGVATWHELAAAVFDELGADPRRVRPCGTDDFPRPAPRPAYSVLDGQAWADAGLTPLRPWRVALGAAMSASK